MKIPNEEQALDWLLKQSCTIVDTQERMTVMKSIDGDLNETVNIKPTAIAYYIAKYYNEHVADLKQSVAGRRFR